MPRTKAKYQRGDAFQSMSQGNIIVITRCKRVSINFKYVYKYWFKKPEDKYANVGSFIHEDDITKYWTKLGKGYKLLYGR